MDQAERDQRRQEIAEQVRSEQERLGHESPVPAFLNLLTEYMIDTDAELAELRDQITNLRKVFLEHNHHRQPSGESFGHALDRLEKLIIDRTANPPIMGRQDG